MRINIKNIPSAIWQNQHAILDCLRGDMGHGGLSDMGH